MNTGMPADPFRTRDLDEAIGQVSRVYAAHDLRLSRRVSRPFDMRLGVLDAQTAGCVVNLRYDADVMVDAADLPGLYLIMTCMAGQGSVRQGSSESAWASGITLPVSANVRTDFHFGEGFDQLSFRPDVQVLSKLCSDWLGRPLECPVRFRLSPFSTELSAAWNQAVQMLVVADKISLQPAVQASLSEFLHGMLLNGHPHNFSEALRSPGMSLSRAMVARAEDYIYEHCENTLTVGEVAAATGVSVRSLQASFRELALGSPVQRMRDIRLQRVRASLEQREGSVTEVALRFGFFHLGRFSAQYQQMFGERPATTLARARQRMSLLS
ncbi:AraC family transcriptional regulator [Alcaligenes faecalis]|uniref:AraC family transcriptional regulator n=1 Tax=Alcaligenes faecalis TaxID=511 RepID=UPI001293B9E5|nr:AraC family transcriptional regulator [Alcaligenes faecalis]MBX6966155.1 AraC family transcriptional regulator [Providencia rettgeri]MBX7032715.1 AraC family transcriptional regulator [Alcaligenes faecalis]